MPWDPAQYLKYGGERTRPAADLLDRIAEFQPTYVFDLGCGPGNSTALLANRWPASHLTAVDGDRAMLGRARSSCTPARWVEADISTWIPERTPDLIFSSSALHWLDDHATLFPRLLSLLRPGGLLALQMPRNFAAPSHRLMYELAAQTPWVDHLRPLIRANPVSRPEDYYRLIAPHASMLEIWETTYLLRLSGKDPVLCWIRGSILRPLLDALPDKDAAIFEATLAERLRAAYPTEADGSTLFPFRRIFIIATR